MSAIQPADKPQHAPETVPAVEETLLAIWREVFEMPALRLEDDFFELGGTSLTVSWMNWLIDKEFGIKLAPTQIFTTSSVATLAAYISARLAAGQDRPPASSFLAPLQPQGTRRPLFCMPGLAGTVFNFQPLAQRLGADQPVYGVLARGLNDDETPSATMPEVVEHCIGQLRLQQPHGPYLLAGHSFGGFIALDVARELQARGERVDLVVLFDPLLDRRPGWPGWYCALRQLARERALILKRGVAGLLGPAPGEGPEGQQRLVALLRELGGYRADLDPRRAAAADERLLLVTAAMLRAFAAGGHRIAPYDGRILYFQATRATSTVWFDQAAAWRMLARGGFELQSVPGSHRTIMDEPGVDVMARLLRTRLQEL